MDVQFKFHSCCLKDTSLVDQLVKNLPAIQEAQFNPWVGKIPWRREWQPLQYSCLENPVDRGAWRATVHGGHRVRHNWATNTFTLCPPGKCCTGCSSFCCSEGKLGFTKDTLILLGKVLSLTHRHLRTNFSENRVLSRMCGTDCDLCHKLCLWADDQTF